MVISILFSLLFEFLFLSLQLQQHMIMCSCFVVKIKPPSRAAALARHSSVVSFKMSITLTNVKGVAKQVYDIYHTRAQFGMKLFVFAKFLCLM